MFCTNFDQLVSNINNLHPTCSNCIEEFDAKHSWCDSDTNNTAGIEQHNITTSGCSQMVDEPTDFVNGSALCIDLIFSTYVSLTKNSGVEQPLFEKCHITIISSIDL